VLRYKPELVSDMSIAYRSAFLRAHIRQWQSYRKRQLDRRVQKIFLKRVNDSVLHFLGDLPVF
jgi:hypothetical protein